MLILPPLIDFFLNLQHLWGQEAAGKALTIPCPIGEVNLIYINKIKAEESYLPLL